MKGVLVDEDGMAVKGREGGASKDGWIERR